MYLGSTQTWSPEMMMLYGDKVPHEALLTLHVGNGNDELTNDSTLTDSTAIGDDDTPVVDKSWF